MTTALLIVDVQHALCTGQYQCFDIQRVIARINALSARARAASIPVVLIQHEEKSDLLQHGSESWQLAKDLNTSHTDLRIGKTTGDSFYQTPLRSLLLERGVDRLIICGLQTDYCVNATVRQAHASGYDVVLAGDAHSTVDNGNTAAEDIIAEYNKTLAHLTGPVGRIDVTAAHEIKF